MEHGALTEETNRFAIALAAAELSARPISMIDGPLDVARRSYFYAVPDGEGAHTADVLSEKISSEKMPTLVDWNRKSEHYGLRYTISGLTTPDSLKVYQSEQAKSEWKSWKGRQVAANKVVSMVAVGAARGQRLGFLDLDVVEHAGRAGRSSQNNFEI